MILRNSAGERIAGTGKGVQGAGGVKIYAADGTRIDIDGGGGGTDVALDLGDTGSPQSLAINEIATIYDRFSVATEPSPDKLLLDFNRLDDKYLSPYPSSPATPDDEFDSGTLNGKWTVVAGTSGTISPYAITGSGDFAIYDLASRPGWIMMQAGDDTTDVVQLRQDYTLPDGSAIYVKVACPSLAAPNSFQVDFSVNQSDTSPFTGTYTAVIMDAENFGYRIYFDGTGTDLATVEGTFGTVIMAIARDGLDYHLWASINYGESWIPGTISTFASEATDLWIGVRPAAVQASGRKFPIASFDWVRLGDMNVYSPGW